MIKMFSPGDWSGRVGRRPLLIAAVVAGAFLCGRAVAQPQGGLQRRPADVDRVAWHTPEPENAAVYTAEQLATATREPDRVFARSLLDRLRTIDRPNEVRLTLEDAVHRALIHNLAVRVNSYTPAISTTRVVEAEAAFDAVYFMSMTKSIGDAPSPTQLVGSATDRFSLTGGFRKLLPTGALVTTSLSLSRISTNNQFQTVNPVYTSAFTAQFVQPLLRNAGIDLNRSAINIAANDFRSSKHAFKRNVREVLFNVERLYWRLVQARRELAIRARVLTEFEQTYDYLWQRRDFDTYHIQLEQTKGDLESSKADFIRIVNAVYDSEDALIAAINDPSLNLADDMEIVPVDPLTAVEPVVDRIGAVQDALDHRAEIAEFRLQIDSANLSVGVAKNQALPRLDLSFSATWNGLGSNGDDAFDQVTQSDFIDYFIGLELDLPVGNRAAEAALRRARLQHGQSIAALKNQIEQVILEVNFAVRRIETVFRLIDPSLASAEANENQVASVVARAERKDFQTLNQELGARRALASSRSALLDALVRYNIAVVDLQRAKGTLLIYNNVFLEDK